MEGGQVLNVESFFLPRFNNVADKRVVHIRIFGNFSHDAPRTAVQPYGSEHGET